MLCKQYETFDDENEGHACIWDPNGVPGRKCMVKREMSEIYTVLVQCTQETSPDCAGAVEPAGAPPALCRPTNATAGLPPCDLTDDDSVIDAWALPLLESAPNVAIAGQCTGNTDYTRDVVCTSPAVPIVGATTGTTEAECCETPDSGSTTPPPPGPSDSSSRQNRLLSCSFVGLVAAIVLI